MPASWKCPQCGLVNFASEQSCARCGAWSHGDQVQPPAAPVGIVLEDGYVMPPPPGIPQVVTTGIWRENSTLVMSKDALLPDHCVKCDAPANGFRLKRRLSWHHPALYLVILMAWLIYLILAMVLRKHATVYIGLCQEHHQKRRNFLIIGWAGLAAGLLITVLGFDMNYPGVGLFGILLFLISIVWLVLIARVVTVKKIDDHFVWLNGIDQNYLARFPPLPQ